MVPDLAEPIVARVREHRGPVVLELDLTASVVAQAPTDPVGRALGRRRIVLGDVVEALRHARDDRRVVGLVARCGGHPTGLGTAQELRGAFEAFRRSGRWVIAWAESFGEFGQGTVPYYLATAADEVWLQPTGEVGIVGVAAEVTFVHNALAKAGVDVEVGQRYEYKNAANVFTEAAFTDAHREATERVVVSAYDQVVAGVAAARGLTESEVRDAIDRAPLGAAEALERRLVDRLGYRDEVYDEVRRRGGAHTQLRFADRYRRHAQHQHPLRRAVRRTVVRRNEPTIALVQGVGGIRLGRSGRHPLTGASMGSDTVTAAFRAAVRDESVRAIVFRVDSPGGSAVASDAIWRAVVLARQAGKPVVVSMGDYAASGGYYVSCPADVIVAQPGTLTGSIGVLGGKAVLRDLLDRLGLTTDAAAAGAHARLFSTRVPSSESGWARMQASLDRIYDDFTGKVAEGRGLTRERVHELARGRVWTGADALERGLVDHLGGLDLALDLARERVGVGDGRVREFPHVTPLARLRPPTSSEDPAAAAFAAGWGGLADLASSLGLPVAGPLSLPFAVRLQ